MRLLTEEREILRELWPFVKPHRGYLAVISVLAVLASAAEALAVSMFVPFVEIVTGQHSGADSFLLSIPKRMSTALSGAGTIVIATTLLLLFMVAKNAFLYAARVLNARVTAVIGREVRGRIFAQLLAVAYSFWVRNTSGRLLEILAGETWRLSQAVTVFCNAVASASVGIVFLSVLMFLSWQLTLLAGCGVLTVAVLLRPLGQRVRRLGDVQVRANTLLWERIWDIGLGIRAIHAFGLEGRKTAQFEAESDKVQRVVTNLDITSGATQPLSEVLYLCLLIATLLIASAAGISLPTAILFVLILFRLHPYMTMLDHDRVYLAGLVPTMQKVAQLLTTVDKPYVLSGPRKMDRFEREIQFAAVTYSYDGSEPVLQGVSFRIPKRQVTAIVGPSGAGKTTILHLLMRFDDPTGGEILVDGSPLKSLSLADWRHRLALSGQDMHLFAASIRENIQYGRLQATEAEVIQAAKDASAHDFIMELPEGYDTLLGDEGARLSGGERQRISLARAFLREPDILLLDEATNALDAATEQAIARAIARFSSERTVVVIAHRLATVRGADFVIVMDQGRVVESGSPDELLSSNRMFAEMYNLQKMDNRP